MDLYDFYFRQIVTQAVMDWSFQKAEEADHNQSVDNLLTGINVGLDCIENHLGADLSVDILAGSGSSLDGRRIHVTEPLTNLDCSVDEFGVSTAVVGASNERYLSVFARFVRNLQEPRIDGNGLEVFTEVLEDAELVVRQGAEAPIGTAARPPYIDGTLKLADVKLDFGQTTIVTVLHIGYTYRQDWIREQATNILDDFVHGNAHDAIADLFAYVDIIWGGGNNFSFNDTWALGVAVEGSSPPPSNVDQALNAIVYDLAGTVSPEGGAVRVGARAYTTLNGYVSWAASNVQTALIEIADAVDGHINGDAPPHPASAITATGTIDYYYLCLITTGTSLGRVVNESDDEGEVIMITGSYNNQPFALIKTQFAGWGFGVGVDWAASGSFIAADFYIIRSTELDGIYQGADLEVALANMSDQTAMRSFTKQLGSQNPVPEAGYRQFNSVVTFEENAVVHSLVGGNHSPKGVFDDLRSVEGEMQSWRVPWVTGSSGPSQCHDLCRGWNYERGKYAVLAIGLSDAVGMLIPEPGLTASNVTYEDRNAVHSNGIAMDTQYPDSFPVAIAANSDLIFILYSLNTSGDSVALYAYDQRRWKLDASDLYYVWHITIPTAGAGVGNVKKTDSKLLCSGIRVYGMLGRESAMLSDAELPLFKCDAIDGDNLVQGRGDSSDDISNVTTMYPSGGLSVNKEEDRVLFSAVSADLLTFHGVIPADEDDLGAASGLVAHATTGIVRDMFSIGSHVAYNVDEDAPATAALLNTWNLENDDHVWCQAQFHQKQNTAPIDTHLAFDGKYFWMNYSFEFSGTVGENYAYVPMPAAGLLRPRSVFVIPSAEGVAPSDHVFINTNNLTTSPIGGIPGRSVAWGPGIWGIYREEGNAWIHLMPYPI